MRYSYLGLFAKIFEWVFEKILSPIVEFLAKLLSKVFEWIFENIVAPILTLVIKTVMPWIIDLFKDIFSGIFYNILAYLCKFIDYLEEAFNIFAGVSPVTDTASNTSAPLLDVLLFQAPIRRLFLLIIAVGFTLALTFCVISVAKAAMDFDFSDRKPVASVMRTMFKTMIQFLIVPLMVLFILNLSSALLTVIDNATYSASQTTTDPNSQQVTGKPTLGSTLFAIASLDADKKGPNVSNGSNVDYMNSGYRQYFYHRTWDYKNADLVKSSFDLSKFDYLTGFAVGIFLLVILVATSIVFIQRIFEVIILYIVSPFFISTMPIDEGERFKRWKDMFYGKLFGGYGAILGMKIYLMLIPFIMGSNIKWGSSSADSSYIMKLLFIIGGAWATYKLGPMVTGLISAEAGHSEAATSAIAGGFAGGAIFKGISATTAFAGRMVGKGFGAIGGAAKGALFGGEGGTEIADQKFGDMRDQQRFDSGEMSEEEEKAFLTKNGGEGFTSEGEEKDNLSLGGKLESNKETEQNESEVFGDDNKELFDNKDDKESTEDGNESFDGKKEENDTGVDENGLLSGSGSINDVDDESEAGDSGDQSFNQEKEESADENKEQSPDLSAAKEDDKEKKTSSGNAATLKTPARAPLEPADSSGTSVYKNGKKMKYTGGMGTARTQNGFDKFLGACHKILPHKANKDGSYSFGLLGFRINYDKNGNRIGFKVPCAKFKYDANGEWRLHKLNFGVAKIQRESASGSFKLKSIPLIGLNRKEDAVSGEMHTTSFSPIGLQRERGKDGQYHVSKVSAIGLSREEHKNGQYTVSSIAGLKFGSTLNKKTGQFETSGVRIGNYVFPGSTKKDLGGSKLSGSTGLGTAHASTSQQTANKSSVNTVPSRPTTSEPPAPSSSSVASGNPTPSSSSVASGNPTPSSSSVASGNPTPSVNLNTKSETLKPDTSADLSQPSSVNLGDKSTDLSGGDKGTLGKKDNKGSSTLK